MERPALQGVMSHRVLFTRRKAYLFASKLYNQLTNWCKLIYSIFGRRQNQWKLTNFKIPIQPSIVLHKTKSMWKITVKLYLIPSPVLRCPDGGAALPRLPIVLDWNLFKPQLLVLHPGRSGDPGADTGNLASLVTVEQELYQSSFAMSSIVQLIFL